MVNIIITGYSTTSGHDWSWPNLVRGFQKCSRCRCRYAVYIAVYTVLFLKQSTHFSIKKHLWCLILESSLITHHPSTTVPLCSVFRCVYPHCSPLNLKTSKLRGVSSHRGPGRRAWSFGTAKAGPWSCPAHRQAAGTSKPQMVGITVYTNLYSGNLPLKWRNAARIFFTAQLYERY